MKICKGGGMEMITIEVEHHIDVIMTTMASQITSLTFVYSTVYSDVHPCEKVVGMVFQNQIWSRL